MKVNLTTIFLVIGIGLISIIAEKTMSKAGNETGAYITGLVTLLVGFSIVILVLKGLLGQVVSTFIIQ